ncbi:hypothetical protein C440_04053 [Haloferax mucosum ATCC BAA-1512]|uniref:Helix-hairpin-helix domain-containing protein n=1 Tax=Haloferax mucosum ATCC BAA-1512 TaxID=662479 RepID=M0IM34_9EURY|nr:helix-hairpin-helix domain-containing protein [Haloferax mucosum]ELZ96918.1 hypothetical protein C440_04053 [Haloferax mucosum ATCC BAA-1512]
MKVHLEDGTRFDCGGYKALDSGGVVLTADAKRKQVIGYVPADQLVYILPEDVAAERDDETPANDEVRTDGESESDADADNTEAGETEVGSDADEPDSGADESDSNADASDFDNNEPDSDDTTVDETTVAAGIEPEPNGVTAVAESTDDDHAADTDRAHDAGHTHEDVVQRIETLEGRVDGLDGRVDAMTEQLADIASGVEAASSETEETLDPEDVRNIRGIGEAYATRLRAAGLDTVSALRAATADEIAAAVAVSERRVSDWKRRADSHVEQAASSETTDADADTDANADTDPQEDTE